MKKITLLFAVFFCHFSLTAQLDYKKESTLQGANYFDIVNTTRAHFQKQKLNKSRFVTSNIKQEKQFERWVFYWKDRIDAKGNFPSETFGYFNAGILDANGKIIAAKKQRVQSETSWTTITNPAGLTINSVDFDQANMAVIYCTVSGYTDGSKVLNLQVVEQLGPMFLQVYRML
mgnify:CR=1 FL=1